MERPVRIDLTRDEARLVIEHLRRYTGGETLAAEDIAGRLLDALDASMVKAGNPGWGRPSADFE